MAKHAAHASRNNDDSRIVRPATGGYRPDDGSSEYPDAFESLEPVDSGPALFDEQLAPIVTQPLSAGSHGRPPKPQLSPQMRKSRRTRRILIVLVVLLLALISALGYLTYRIVVESGLLGSQQAQEQQANQDVDVMTQDSSTGTDAVTSGAKVTRVPELDALLGLTRDEALAQLGASPSMATDKEAGEDMRPIMTSVTVKLIDEPSDTRSGNPSVYLGLDSEGVVIEAGYSAATGLLGFSASSFGDAVVNDRIIQNAMAEAGVAVSDADVALPEDRSVYATYADDGKTLVKERCSFSGTVSQNGLDIEWSAVLIYDYTTSNKTGNLADTIRLVYLYLDAPSIAAPVPEPEPEEGSEEGGEESGGEGSEGSSDETPSDGAGDGQA